MPRPAAAWRRWPPWRRGWGPRRRPRPPGWPWTRCPGRLTARPAVAALAPRLGPAEAADATRRALAAYALFRTGDPVAALLVEVRPEEVSQRARCLAAVLGSAAVAHPLLGLAPLPEAARPFPGRF